MRLTKHYLMLLGIISLLVLQGASINLRTHHSTLASIVAGSECSDLTGAQTLLFDVGDVDGDGADDFIVRPRKPKGCERGDNYLMISTGKGDFKRENLDCSLDFKGLDTVLTFGDFDGDGREDILRTEAGESRAELLLYIASGEFLRVVLSRDYDLASDSSTVIIGDFNGDGKDDFIRQQFDTPAQVFLSTCSPKGVTFSQEVIPNTATCLKIVVGDYNGDKKDDFICQEGNKDGSSGYLFLSSGDGKFTKKDLPEGLKIEGDELPKLHVGDFNQDGKTDFIRQTACTESTPRKASSSSSSSGYWTDWTTFTAAQLLPGNAASGSGVINTLNGPVQVTYTGDAYNAVTNGGFGSFTNAPQGTYVNGPTLGDALYFNKAQRKETFKFSQPVINPRIALWSVGQPGLPVTLDFSPNKVKILSYGQSREYPHPSSKLEILDGTKVRGYEGNGIIEIEGTFTELTFNKIGDEYYYTLTLGISDTIQAPSEYFSWYWTDWTMFVAAQLLPGRAGSAVGTINTNAGAVYVSYTGDAYNGVTNGAFKGFTNAPQGTYLNGPTIGDALYFNRAQRKESFTFSQPVVNPRIAVWSMGQAGLPVTFDFSPNKVRIVSYGQSKEYPTPSSRLEVLDSTKLRGYEGNGIIEIQGTFTELTFVKIGDENYYTLTLGISSNSCPASSLFLATGNNGEFTNVALPKDWQLDSKYANLYVGDFNYDGRSDFLRQDTGSADASHLNEITAYVCSLSASLPAQDNLPFTQSEVFGSTSTVRGSHDLSTLYLGDFNGDSRTDYIQYWSDSCYETVTARYVGGCRK